LFLFHSYECQRIKTNNPFDKILGLSFNLGPLKVKPIVLEGINFAKGYQKDPCKIKQNWWENLRNKDLLDTFKKHSYL
jgi:hypothetical protein